MRKIHDEQNVKILSTGRISTTYLPSCYGLIVALVLIRLYYIKLLFILITIWHPLKFCAWGKCLAHLTLGPVQIYFSDVRIEVQRGRVDQVEQMAPGNLWDRGSSLFAHSTHTD